MAKLVAGKMPIKKGIPQVEISNATINASTDLNQQTKLLSKIGVPNKGFIWKNSLDVKRLAGKRLSSRVLKSVAKKLMMPEEEVYGLLTKSVSAQNAKIELNVNEKEKAILLDEVLNYGTEVFNKEEKKFKHWLNNPNPQLEQRSPIELLDSFSGIAEVKQLLYKIDYGIYS